MNGHIEVGCIHNSLGTFQLHLDISKYTYEGNNIATFEDGTDKDTSPDVVGALALHALHPCCIRIYPLSCWFVFFIKSWEYWIQIQIRLSRMNLILSISMSLVCQRLWQYHFRVHHTLRFAVHNAMMVYEMAFEFWVVPATRNCVWYWFIRDCTCRVERKCNTWSYIMCVYMLSKLLRSKWIHWSVHSQGSHWTLPRAIRLLLMQ